VSLEPVWIPPAGAARIGVLSNPRAGRSAVRASQVASLLRGQPDVVHVATDDSGSVPGVLAEFARTGVNVIVVNGGDGTLQQVLTAMLGRHVFDRLPLVAPLRGGRTNMSAIDIGCQSDSARALKVVVDKARGGVLARRLVKRPVLRVDMGDDVQYGMFCGVGVIHRAVDLIHRAFPPGKRTRGAVGAGVLTGILVARAAMRSASGILLPDRIDMRLDGERVSAEAFQLAIATTLGRLFLKINPFWGEGPGAVRLTAVAVTAERKWRSAIGILRGRPPAFVGPARGYTSRNVHRAELRLDCGLCIDGELFAPKRDRLVRLEADERIHFLRA
jgi:diacylglycerol kinase family enzyme